MKPTITNPSGPHGSGSAAIDEEKQDRKRRMIEGLRHDLLVRSDLTPEARQEAVQRLVRWEAEVADAG